MPLAQICFEFLLQRAQQAHAIDSFAPSEIETFGHNQRKKSRVKQKEQLEKNCCAMIPAREK